MSPTARLTLCAALSATLALTACAPVEDLLGDAVPGTSTRPPEPDVDQVDRDDPFSGTEAEDFAEGFEAPEAESVGDYPGDRVQEAHDMTAEYLDAVYLERDAVFDEDNSVFTELLTEEALDWYLDHHGHEDPDLDTQHVPFNLAPGTAEPIGDVVKVDGSMWAETAQDELGQDYLAVNTEYTIVHPVSRPGASASVRLVTSHYGEVSFYDVGDGTWEAFPQWWRAVGPTHCLLDEHTFAPAYADEEEQGEQVEGAPDDAYDLDSARDQEECGAIQDT